LLGSELNSLALNAESAQVLFSANVTNREINALLTLKLGSFTPGTNPAVTARMVIGDGTDTPDRSGGRLIPFNLTAGASAKVVTETVVIPPFPVRFSFINNAGAPLAASGHAFHITQFGEDTTTV
jgi:hypothetical protein